MRQLDQTNYSINAEQFVNLAPSLEAFFEHTGVLRNSSSQLRGMAVAGDSILLPLTRLLVFRLHSEADVLSILL